MWMDSTLLWTEARTGELLYDHSSLPSHPPPRVTARGCCGPLGAHFVCCTVFTRGLYTTLNQPLLNPALPSPPFPAGKACPLPPPRVDPVVLSMLTQRGFFHDAAGLVLAITALHQHIMQPQTLPSATEGECLCVCVLRS